MRLRTFAVGIAAALWLTPALAATVTVNPPPFNVTIDPPAYSYTLPTGTAIDLGPLTARIQALEAVVGKNASDDGALNARLGALEAAVNKLVAGGGVAPPPPPAPTGGPLADPCAGRTDKWTTLTVKPSDNIEAALACAAPVFQLTLSDGDYHQKVHVGPGFDGSDIGGTGAGKVKMHMLGCTTGSNSPGSGCGERLAWGKGLWHVQSAVTVHDMELADAGSANAGAHDGQAGLYVDEGFDGKVTARHIMFRHNQNGMFANANAHNVDLVIEECDFVENSTDGGSHSSYLAGGRSATYNNIHDYGSVSGNDQKSRVPVVTVNGGFFKSNQGRWVEAADGAVMTINGGVFVGNTCCQNQFGNGTESTSQGPGNTTWSNSTIYIGRNTDFANAGTFQATGIKLFTFGSGPAIFNDKGTPLNGLDLGTATAQNPPADPPYISGAK